MNQKPTPLERILFLATALLAAFQVVIGIEGLGAFEIVCYTVGFGVILVSSLLLMIMGFEILGSAPVVILATIIPLSISTGLVAQFLPAFLPLYLVFDGLGLAAIVATRYFFHPQTGSANRPTKLASITLAVVHGLAGLVIFILPAVLTWKETVPVGFSMVGIGGALFGLAGILLSLLRAGKSPVPPEKVTSLLPPLLLLTTAAFVAGFSFV